jgi:hypothetical protein
MHLSVRCVMIWRKAANVVIRAVVRPLSVRALQNLTLDRATPHANCRHNSRVFLYDDRRMKRRVEQDLFHRKGYRSSCVARKISRECDSLETLLFMTRRLTQLGPCLMHSSGCCYRVSIDTFSLKGEISPRRNLQLSPYLYSLSYFI